MKTIDFDAKIIEVQGELAQNVPKAKAPVKDFDVNIHRLKLALKVISNELLKDPVLVSLMAFRNDPTPKSMESFLATVKMYIDYATAVRYRETLSNLFVAKEIKNDQVV